MSRVQSPVLIFRKQDVILVSEVIFLNDQINYYEYKVQKKESAKQKLKRFLFKLVTIIAAILLTFLIIVVISHKAESALMFFIVISPAIGAAIYLSVLFFFNGFFHNTYEYIIQSGNLRITKVNGSFVFGKTYRKDLVNMRISNLDRIAPFKYNPNSSSSIKTFYALSKPDHPSAYYLDYTNNGEKIRVVFETTPRMISMLKFHNSEKMI